MPGWLKVLLIVVVVIVVLVLGCIGAGVYYVSRNKDAWIARGKAVATEGRDFGRNSDNQGCVDESISRYKKEPGLGERDLKQPLHAVVSGQQPSHSELLH